MLHVISSRTLVGCFSALVSLLVAKQIPLRELENIRASQTEPLALHEQSGFAFVFSPFKIKRVCVCVAVHTQ